MGLQAVIIGWIVIASFLAYQAFALDKARAELGRFRISEQTLLGLALLGGSPGAIAAQQFLRHKTRKEPFRTVLYCIALVQLIALAMVVMAPGLVGRSILDLVR